MWSFDAVPLVPQMDTKPAISPTDFDFEGLDALAYPQQQQQPLKPAAAQQLNQPPLQYKREAEHQQPHHAAENFVPLGNDTLANFEDLCASMSDEGFDATFSSGTEVGQPGKDAAGGAGSAVPLPFSDLGYNGLRPHQLGEDGHSAADETSTLACPLALTIATEMGNTAAATAAAGTGSHSHSSAAAATGGGGGGGGGLMEAAPRRRRSLTMDRTIEAVRAQMDLDVYEDSASSSHSDDASASDHDGTGRHHGTVTVLSASASAMAAGAGSAVRRSARAVRTRVTNLCRTASKQGGGAAQAHRRPGSTSTKGRGKKPVQDSSCNPSLPIPQNAVLATNHVIARGRRRRIQLSKMTKEQIAVETEARMEKNRQLARDCRRRKKMKINGLEEKVTTYEATITKQASQITKLEAEVARLRAMAAW